MSKPKALDLFCKAGGATRGLQEAGYHVTGVDIEPQPNYIGDEFLRASALLEELIRPGNLRRFDLIWASPPCQQFTAYRRKNPAKVGARAPNLIPPIREALLASGVPYIIENVPAAPLEDPIILCGSMFGLEVRRHRAFETSHKLAPPACQHHLQQGDFPQATNRANRRKTVEVGVWRIPLDVQKRAMGIDWMTLEELSEAIPPAYSKWLALALTATASSVRDSLRSSG